MMLQKPCRQKRPRLRDAQRSTDPTVKDDGFDYCLEQRSLLAIVKLYVTCIIHIYIYFFFTFTQAV